MENKDINQDLKTLRIKYQLNINIICFIKYNFKKLSFEILETIDMPLISEMKLDIPILT